MKLNFILIIVLLPFLLKAQGGLIIGSGATVVASDAPQIVIKNTNFKNHGDFQAANSTVHMTGDGPIENSTVGGMNVTAFNHLNINKSNNDVRLDFDIIIDGDLKMNGGLFLLNHSDVTLGGSIEGETGTNRITGPDGGAIIKTVDLNMPVSENPGNIGAEITVAYNLGSTVIRRSHVPMENEGNYSIFRRYDISPAYNSNLDATLRFHYFDAELGALNELDLLQWQTNESNWAPFSPESVNHNENWIQSTGIPFFHTMTLAEDMIALPVELIYFQAVVNDKKQVNLHWSTDTEINNDFFSIERSQDGIVFETIEKIDGAGNSSEPKNYYSLDPTPHFGTSYYRLRQTDFNGAETLSDTRVVQINIDREIAVYPNPMEDVLHIVSKNPFGKNARITITDELGATRYSQRLDQEGEHVRAISIEEVSRFEDGIYFLRIEMAGGEIGRRLVKISK